MGDITLGDFWGIDQIEPTMDDDQGCSLVLANSQKGRREFAAIETQLHAREYTLDAAVRANQHIVTSAIPHKRAEEFYFDLEHESFEYVVHGYLVDRSRLSRVRWRLTRGVTRALVSLARKARS